MTLSELTVQNVRCIEQAQLDLHPGRNLIWGGNGMGKTSLLEALFLLGRGRSFRTRNSERLIRSGSDRLVVFGRTHATASHAMGVEVDRQGGTRARLDGVAVPSLAELSRALPVQVIDPEAHKLIEESGRRRRRWLDWAVFHVEPRFGDWWVRYSRVLKQRNAALRQRSGTERPWERDVVTLGQEISEARRTVLDQLQPHWRAVQQALGCPEGELHYAQGWSTHHTLVEALDAGRSRDLARGLTHAGPHRADVLIRCHGRPAREVLSRGQQKLSAVALILAQLRLLRELTGILPVLLLDDPAAELDADHLEHFVSEINQLGSQWVMTSLHPDTSAFGQPDRVFHVEHGRVRPV